MADPREEGIGPSQSNLPPSSSERAGTILRIKLENFMCHSGLTIDFTDRVNFITGQNGSGKSAILTALCVAFGSKARGTQRATSLKDFIKNGCSHALVVVEMNNEGIDAFKPDDYGRKIIIERRITESGNTSVLKDSQGKKIASKKEDIHELVEHFNIDVENPCVIMTQDKSREFLHSGSGKDKFKFFFRATLLQQVLDLLKGIQSNVEGAGAIIDEIEQELRPHLEDLKLLQEKLKIVENVEQMAHDLGILRRMAAWSEVNDVEKQLQEENVKLETYRTRIPRCEERINKLKETLDKFRGAQRSKKEAIASMLQKTKEFRQKQDDLQKRLAQATKDDAQLEEEQNSRQRSIQQMVNRVHWLERQIIDIRELHVQASQAEETEREQNFLRLQSVIDETTLELRRLESESSAMERNTTSLTDGIRVMLEEVEEKRREQKDLQTQLQRIRRQQNNKVTAFGGDIVLRLLRVVEEHHREFTRPPLGPIGAHVALIGDDNWAIALEAAIGRLLSAFIVTNHKDMLLLRDCAKFCGYHNLQIVIYDFDRLLLNIPPDMLPNRNLVTVKSVLHTEKHTVMNVLIDQGNVERQVLVKDYDEGKRVVFERRAEHVKEALTQDGTRMFTRGSAQTTLPPDSRLKSGRLCAAVDDAIRRIERDISNVVEDIHSKEQQKHSAEVTLQTIKNESQNCKRRKLDLQRGISRQQLKLRDLRNAAQAEANLGQDPNVDELEQEILKLKSEIQSKEDSMEKLKIRRGQTQEKTSEARSALDALHELAKGDIETLQEAENELVAIEEEIMKASSAEAHYKKVMQEKVILQIRQQEAEIQRLTQKHEEIVAKASEICSREEVDALGLRQKRSEQIKAEMSRLKDRLRREEGRHEESADELRNRFNRQNRRVEKKQNQYKFYREKLNMVEKALALRFTKFERNSSYLKKQLTWQFNGHLRKKGMSGKIIVDFSEEMLAIQVQMPQDTSNNMVNDTRGLSGGERSFSTLCFALALQEMTEAPFRAMDEFDVFMDAVSRKISLDTVVDFAVSHGSQWIFITPHDISMVKTGPHVKKQQLAAPRP